MELSNIEQEDLDDLQNSSFEELYNFFLNKTLIDSLNVYTAKFVSPNDVFVYGDETDLQNIVSEGDKFIESDINSDYSFVEDIRKNGTYWPLYCVKIENKYYITAGYHRCLAFREIAKTDINKKILVFFYEATELEQKNMSLYKPLLNIGENTPFDKLDIRRNTKVEKFGLRLPLVIHKNFPRKKEFFQSHLRHLTANGYTFIDNYTVKMINNIEDLSTGISELAAVFRDKLFENKKIKASPLINDQKYEEYWSNIKKKK